VANKSSQVFFTAILSLIVSGLAVAQVVAQPYSWQSVTDISTLPVSSDTPQAQRFYAVLPTNVTLPNNTCGWIEIRCSGKNDTCFARLQNIGAAESQDDDKLSKQNLSKSVMGLSKALANYLRIDDQSSPIQWRFVENNNVRPGLWLKNEEQFIILTAIREKDSAKGGSSNPQTDLAKVRALYLQLYLKISEAEIYLRKADVKKAAEDLTNVLVQLKSIQKMAPSWEQVLVSKRIIDVRAQLLDINR
jgi:hypothetical protein